MGRLDYAAFLGGLPDAVIGVDGNLRIVFWNPAAESLCGRSARRVLGRTLKEVLPAEASVVGHLAETVRSGESRSEAEAVIEGPDGRPVPVGIVTAPLTARGGEAGGAVAVLRDLTRVRQLEDEVRRGERLAAAGRMAIGLAHEIRNPLSAIRGVVQLLTRELGGRSRWGEHLEVLVKEVDRMNRILEVLLDLGHPVQLRLAPLNLHQLLERVALLTEETAARANVTIVRRYDPSLPPILGDEDRLVQVVHNLVRNALDAMPGGGRLTLSTRVSMKHVFAKMDLGGGMRNMAEVEVRDEGEGIPAASMGKIFDPFFTTKERGLGLGLALCHRIVEEHKGAIHVESEPGQGTTAICFLPIAR